MAVAAAPRPMAPCCEHARRQAHGAWIDLLANLAWVSPSTRAEFAAAHPHEPVALPVAALPECCRATVLATNSAVLREMCASLSPCLQHVAVLHVAEVPHSLTDEERWAILDGGA